MERYARVCGYRMGREMARSDRERARERNILYDSRERLCEQTASPCAQREERNHSEGDGLLLSKGSELYFTSGKVTNKMKSTWLF